MLKHTLFAAISLTALSLAPLPVLTGAALGQAAIPPRCTAQVCPGGDPGESTYQCSNELGYLRRVYEDELELIENPNNVSIMPVCEGFGVFRNDGNAGGLRVAIADNDAMMEALFLKNFRSEDVVGVRMTDEDKVILYVSLWQYR